MKLFDEKGRLFGKVNIVDLAIVILAIIMIPTFFHIYRILNERTARTPSAWIRVKAVTFTLTEIAELIKPGDIAYDRERNVCGKVLHVISKDEKRYIEKFNAFEQIKESTIPSLHIMPVVVELELLSTKKGQYENWNYQTRPLAVSMDYGYRFYFETDKYTLVCFALKIAE